MHEDHLWDRRGPPDRFVEWLEQALAERRARVLRAGRPRWRLLLLGTALVLVAAFLAGLALGNVAGGRTPLPAVVPVASEQAMVREAAGAEEAADTPVAPPGGETR